HRRAVAHRRSGARPAEPAHDLRAGQLGAQGGRAPGRHLAQTCRAGEEAVIQHHSFRVEPWSLHETSLSLDVLSQTESLFALGNGHLGVRGNLDEGEPHGLPGTYLNGVYELRPLLSAETMYGAPESSQTLIDITNGKVIRLLVDDEPFDVRYGQLESHDRKLDFRAGTLTRTAQWRSPARRTVRVTSVRLV